MLSLRTRQAMMLAGTSLLAAVPSHAIGAPKLGPLDHSLREAELERRNRAAKAKGLIDGRKRG